MDAWIMDDGTSRASIDSREETTERRQLDDLSPSCVRACVRGLARPTDACAYVSGSREACSATSPVQGRGARS
jgi:hypothetical protein